MSFPSFQLTATEGKMKDRQPLPSTSRRKKRRCSLVFVDDDFELSIPAPATLLRSDSSSELQATKGEILEIVDCSLKACRRMNHKGLIYSFVAKETVVLAEHTSYSGNFSTIVVQCLQKLPKNSNKYTYSCDGHTFNFLLDSGFSDVGVVDRYDFDYNRDENKPDFKKITAENWIEPPKRERKRNYFESEYFKQTMRQGGLSKPKEPRIPRMPQLHDFQFFNTYRLTKLYEKEVRYHTVENQKNQSKDSIDMEEQDDLPLTAEEQEEKESLLEQGFSTWTRRDFNAFLRACEKYGRNDVKSIATEMEGKTEEDVNRYAEVFKERYKEMEGKTEEDVNHQ